MLYGAGVVAARRFGAAEIIDPRPYAVRSIAETFQKYPNTARCCRRWAMAASRPKTWRRRSGPSPADLVLIGTPIDLNRVIKIDQPSQRVRYELQEIGQPTLEDILREKFGK